MSKLRIGNLTNDKRSCNCGKTAKWYIFFINDKNDKWTFFKCDECIVYIKCTLDKLIKI